MPFAHYCFVHMTPFFFSFFLWNTKLYLDILRGGGGGVISQKYCFVLHCYAFVFVFVLLFVCLFCI